MWQDCLVDSFLPGLFVALIEKVCIADYQLGWQDFVAYNFQIQIVMINDDDDGDDDGDGEGFDDIDDY